MRLITRLPGLPDLPPLAPEVILRLAARAIRHFAEGFGMGVANVIPGVSGGTMALVFGIFERLVGALRDAVGAGLSLVRADFRGFVSRAYAIPWAFVLSILAGVATAPLVGAGLVERLLTDYPEAMRGLFLGLIVGSLPVPWLRTQRRGGAGLALLVAAAVAAWAIAGLPIRESVSPSGLAIFSTAALAVTAMILPGISGSYVLLVLGMYVPMLQALDALDVRYLAVFTAGAAAGLAAFSVVLHWLLRTRHDTTMLVLVGLMAGSLRALWPWQSGSAVRLPAASDPVAAVLALTVLGLALSGALTAVEVGRMRRAQASRRAMPRRRRSQASR